MHFKSFAWKRDCPISSKLKTLRIWPKSFKKTLIDFYKLHPVYFLKAVGFCLTFDIQIEKLLFIFWEKLQNQTFQKVRRSLSKYAKIHINRATYYEITVLQKYEKFAFFGGSFFKKQLLTFEIFNESIIWAKVYHIWKIEVYGSTIVEITGRRSCYFISLNIVQVNLITNTQE